MGTEELSAAHRDELLAKHRAARARYNAFMEEHVRAVGLPGEIGVDEESSVYVDSLAHRSARQEFREMATIEQEYFARLPRLQVAVCPHCERPLYRSFDALGLDGLWWRSDATPEEPQACPHFCVLLGAVDLGEHRPRPDFDVHPGPGTPFVLPRLLGYEAMTAVVASLPLVDGATAYPIAYFAARRPPVQLLTASWARTNFVYTTQLGEHGWRRADELPDGPGTETRDFELRQWLKSGQLRWCDPLGDRTALSAEPPSTCPFLDLRGPRFSQVIRAGS